jgi:hypothetical protein
MTLSNSKLVSHYKHGGEKGQSNNMEIEKDGGYTVVWGYDWAVYSIRTPDGNVFNFTGWSSYSKTSSMHLSLLGSSHTTEVNHRPESIAEARGMVDELRRAKSA